MALKVIFKALSLVFGKSSPGQYSVHRGCFHWVIALCTYSQSVINHITVITA